MKIGLYSEFARMHVARIREEIKSTGACANENFIREFREHLIASSEQHHLKIHKTPDFYSLSEVRDLLFHVQEKRFTIPRIIDCLFQLDLTFCGFEADKLVTSFRQNYSNPDDIYNLSKWHEFEMENSDSFAGMYQFWCQKTH